MRNSRCCQFGGGGDIGEASRHRLATPDRGHAIAASTGLDRDGSCKFSLSLAISASGLAAGALVLDLASCNVLPSLERARTNRRGRFFTSAVDFLISFL